MFTPKWKKEAKLLAKGAQKFVNYKRDLLKQERVEEIESRREDLLKAIKEGNQLKAREAGKQLRGTCENSLKYEKPVGWLEENVEVMFVAIVIALGLRAYYLQPFRIPTGSMQPTLNGIVGRPLEGEWPSLPKRAIDFVLKGRTYVRLINDRDRTLAITPYGREDLRDTQSFHFFSRSQLYFTDSKPLTLPAPSRPMRSIGLNDAITLAAKNNRVLPKGTVIAEGMIDTGDLVLVNKFAYHFRKPKRGEVFVFDTNGIQGIKDRSGEQADGTHYIKRLCGLPGDTLSIQMPNLLVDGKIASEPGIQRVMKGGPPFLPTHRGYNLPIGPDEMGPNGKRIRLFLSYPTNSLHLAKNAPTGQREYAALGDNTSDSLDSRYWGSVKEHNLLGPGLFSLWPITTGHWGFIH